MTKVIVDRGIHFAVGRCSLGSILVARTERGVCAILLGDEPEELARDLRDRFPQGTFIDGDSIAMPGLGLDAQTAANDVEAAFHELIARVVGFVEAPGVEFPLPLDVRGTGFQRRVWQALREIPVGQTVSYSELARRIGSPKSVRAVGQACGANPLAVAIPCHRAVRTDGKLSGYRWGIERKRALLRREAEGRSSI